MEQPVGLRVQFLDPVKAPFRFVEHVSDAVRPLPAVIVNLVGEFRLFELVREQHARRRVRSRDQILELVAGVVPAAARIDERSVRDRRIERAAVALMADHIEERIVPATLLPHKEQQVLLYGRVVTDREPRRLARRALELQIEPPCCFEIRKIKDVGERKRASPIRLAVGADHTDENGGVGQGIDDKKLTTPLAFRDQQRALRIFRAKTDLIDADERFPRVHRPGSEKYKKGQRKGDERSDGKPVSNRSGQIFWRHARWGDGFADRPFADRWTCACGCR